jgi:hypothetical protein
MRGVVWGLIKSGLSFKVTHMISNMRTPMIPVAADIIMNTNLVSGYHFNINSGNPVAIAKLYLHHHYHS